jgi:hypothetical protein
MDEIERGGFNKSLVNTLALRACSISP